MPRRLKQRGGIWYYSRQVPARFADVDPRGWVAVSLETRDLARAERLKASVERELEAYWVSLKRGNSDDGKERYRGAIDRARLEGFDYKPAKELEESSLEEILARLQRLEELGALRADGAGSAKVSTGDKLAVEAVLGGVDQPTLRLSNALEEFYKLTRDKIRAKSDDQVRRWKAPRLKAIKNMIFLVGDKALADVTRTDALVLRAWWQDRVIDEDYDPDTANKDFGHLSQIFDTLNEALQLDMSKPFARLRLEADEKTTKVPFTTKELQAIALPATLAGMNEEAVAIVHTMIETGMRPSEICGLEADDIVLDAEVPHVRIRPKPKRKLKTVYSEREIPLVGVSLLALQRFPAGFPAYRDRTSQLSALVNKVMRGRGLLPTDRHSLYSVRHSFQDRLTAVDMGDRMQAELMGHKFSRPEYGHGPTLKHKLEWLLRIAVTNAEDEALQPPAKT